MKYLFPTIFLGLFCVFTSSCKKGTTKENEATSRSVVGIWELRRAQTGMIPTISYPSGNGNLLKFTATEYQLYSSGLLLKSGTYAIVQDTTALPGECVDIRLDRIIYDNNRNDSKRIQQTSGNKLIFYSGCFPLDTGIYYEYERQGDKR